MKEPLISIIIPVFNEEKDIALCLESLRAQTYKNTEIIVVDDNSSDSTVKIANEFNITLLKQPHLGPGPARNLGAKIAKGTILVFVDADMTFEKEFIDRLTLPVRKGQAIGTFSLEEFVSNWDNIWSRCWNWNSGNPDRIRVGDKSHDHEDFRSIMTSEFVSSGGFDPVGYTDSRTLSAKLNQKPFPAPGAVYYHRNPESLKEIFTQSRWIGKRKMKFGIVGQVINLIRSSLPLSILSGVIMCLAKKESLFILFKIIYDFGFSVGIIEKLINNTTAR